MCHSPRVPPEIVLFDLDGTLTDSAPGILNGIRIALADQGLQMPDEAVQRTFLGPPLVDTFGGYYGMSASEVERAIATYREHYHDVGLFENTVYDGIPELLEELTALGMTLAVSTSKPTYSATRILEHFDLSRHFAFIGGAELDGSRQTKAEVIAHTLDVLAERGQLDEATTRVMVGDRAHDVRGAATHGIDCIGVLWGYGDEAELTTAGAAAIAADPDELHRLVAGGDLVPDVGTA